MSTLAPKYTLFSIAIWKAKGPWVPLQISATKNVNLQKPKYSFKKKGNQKLRQICHTSLEFHDWNFPDKLNFNLRQIGPGVHTKMI